MLVGFLNIIILLGALQGLIVSCLLFFTGNKHLSSRLLAGLISIFVLASLNIWLSGQNWFQSNMYFQIASAVIPMVIIMPAGPLLYFYSKSIVDPGFSLSRKDLKNFAGVIIDLIPHLIASIYLINLTIGDIKNNPSPVFGFIDTYNVYADLPRWLSLTIYLLLIVKLVKSYKDKAKENSSLKWIQQLTTVFFVYQAIWLLYLIPYLIPALNGKLLDSLNWYPIYIPLSILIYWLGIKGYLIQHMSFKKPVNLAELSSATVDETIDILKKAMEFEMLYFNPKLNLNLVSSSTGIAPKIISAVLNQYLSENFNDFVNRYRIEAFKSKFSSLQHEHLTITGLAFECGFSSQSTFQRAFKQFTGLSPKEFRCAASSLKTQ